MQEATPTTARQRVPVNKQTQPRQITHTPNIGQNTWGTIRFIKTYRHKKSHKSTYSQETECSSGLAKATRPWHAGGTEAYLRCDWETTLLRLRPLESTWLLPAVLGSVERVCFVRRRPSGQTGATRSLSQSPTKGRTFQRSHPHCVLLCKNQTIAPPRLLPSDTQTGRPGLKIILWQMLSDGVEEANCQSTNLY